MSHRIYIHYHLMSIPSNWVPHLQDDQIDEQFSSNVWCKFYWILKHSNMLVDLPQITTAVNTALLHLKNLEANPDQLYDSLSSQYTAV
jgi:hypothetical protein